jgi:hypothetical protein
VDKHTVVAATNTNIGVRVAADKATQTPEVQIGYNRQELAFVPTNRPAKESQAAPAASPPKLAGADETGEVVMEIRADGSFGMGVLNQGGIRQRLAVGKIAVMQPSALALMARDDDGKLDANAVKAAAESVKSLPAVERMSLSSLADLVAEYEKAPADQQKKFDAAAEAVCGEGQTFVKFKVKATEDSTLLPKFLALIGRKP